MTPGNSCPNCSGTGTAREWPVAEWLAADREKRRPREELVSEVTCDECGGSGSVAVGGRVMTQLKFDDLSDGERQQYTDKAVELLQDHYICLRVWEAWGYGTMSQDDFVLAAENDCIVTDTAVMLYDFVQLKIAEKVF